MGVSPRKFPEVRMAYSKGASRGEAFRHSLRISLAENWQGSASWDWDVGGAGSLHRVKKFRYAGASKPQPR
jgi:hypothetical protein